MRTSSTKNSLIIGLSIVLGASLLSVGVSNATGTSIKACAKKSNGAMRLIDVSKKCKKSERTLTWGTQGSAGATGPAGSNGGTGATGANGAAGANVLSTAYVFTNSQSTIFQVAPASAIVTALNLPAGRYVWSHSMEVSFVNPLVVGSVVTNLETNQLACWIAKSDSPNYLPEGAFWPDSTSNAPFRISFPDIARSEQENATAFAVNGTFELSQQTSLYLMCAYEGGTIESDSDRFMNLRYPTMTFTKVNELLP